MKNVTPDSVMHSLDEHELTKAKNIIDQFVYSCYHTMRGPLKSISGLVYLMKNTAPNDAVNNALYLESIEKTVAKMENLLSGLEEFITNSKKKLSTRAIHVENTISEILEDFADAINENHIGVTLNIRQSIPFHNDSTQFAMILSHLISNAIMFQDIDKPMHRIRIDAEVKPRRLDLRISDNGIGINARIIPDIFILFFRGTEISKGSGVGLYIVSETLKSLGGKISLKSKPMEGSTFSISIPNLG
jgi:signal transduction histidine kinase